MRVRVVGIVTALLLFGATIRCAPAQEKPQQPPQIPSGKTQIATSGGDSDFDPNQPIKAGFQISLTTSSAAGPEPDWSGPFSVDPTGSIQLKLVGLVQLRGLTPAQAAEKITKSLGPYLKQPKVSVTILSVPKPVIFLGGALNQNEKGPVNINDDTTLATLLSIVAYDENADLSKVRITRKDDMGNLVIKEYDLLRWFKPMPGEQPDQTQNPVLIDRDFVFVPLKALPSTGIISVEGAVGRPGPVPLRNGVPLTIREALSRAGGLSTGLAAATTPAATAPGAPPPSTAFADRHQVIVRRVGMDRPFVLDYDKLESGDPVYNIPLLPDDVVYVQSLGPEFFVNMNGGFIRPGRIPYVRTMTLTQAIGDSGGIALNSKEHDGRIYRHVGGADPTKTQVVRFNYKKIRDNREPDVLLEPGDTVEIPLANPPRPPLDGLQMAQSLLSIALLVDRLFGSGGRGGGF